MCDRYVRRGAKQNSWILHAQPNPSELLLADADHNAASTIDQLVRRQ